MQQSFSRRAWLSSLVSGAGVVVAATACGSSPAAVELNTPEGKVLQWQGDDLLVLVSGYAPAYRAGEAIRVTVLVNNQTTRAAQVRVRTKLLTRGDQPVVEAPEVATLAIKPEDAVSIERTLQTPRALAPGEYTLDVQIPPWRLDGQETGRLALLRTFVQITPP